MGKSLCFTGHRPDKLGGFNGERAENIQKPLFQRMKNVIISAINNGFDTFITGGALGVDQLAALAVINLKGTHKHIKLIIAKPFPSQGSKWPLKSQERLENLCINADEVVNVSNDPYSREKMMVRNEWMVNHSDVVIAFWNGGNGGTGNCVRYARSKFKPILIINPYTLVEKWELPGKTAW